MASAQFALFVPPVPSAANYSYRSLSQCWHTNYKFNNKNTIFVLLPFPDFILWHWSGL